MSVRADLTHGVRPHRARDEVGDVGCRNGIQAQYISGTRVHLRERRRWDTLFDVIKELDQENTWKLYTDEASSSDGSRAGLILVKPKGREYTYTLRIKFETTNNEAEYEALLAGLRIAKETKIKDLGIFVDSQLVANQVKGLIESRQPVIQQYLEKTRIILKSFKSYSMEHIRERGNGHHQKEEAENYMAPIREYLLLGKLPNGINIVGLLLMTPGGARFLAVAIDYFTKWVKAKPLIIISDNEKKFVEGTFPDFCQRLGILQAYTSVYHPQANGQFEVTNKDVIKRNEINVNLVYGSEAIIPIKISMETKQIQNFDTKQNKKRRREDLDIIEERREITSIKEAYYKQKLEGYCNKRVRPYTFKPGTHVLRLNSASKAEFQGKMGPTWEGPHIIKRAYRDEAYKLETLSGSLIDQTWNGSNLRKFYM
ncbi:reverse transcriptase domain-containing protein [Tanacetum coccineum]